MVTDEREADPELEEEGADVLDEDALEVTFADVGGELEEVEDVGVFERLLCQVGARLRQRALEVGQRFALAMVETALDLGDEYVPRPAV